MNALQTNHISEEHLLHGEWMGEEIVLESYPYIWTVSKRDNLQSYPNHPFVVTLRKQTPKGKYHKDKIVYRYVYEAYRKALKNAYQGYTLHIERIKLEMAHKEAKKQANKSISAADHFKVGEMIVNSWGYDQTNVEFYQVIEIKNKTLVVREVSQEMHGDAYGMSCDVVPVSDSFIGDQFSLRVKATLYNGKVDVAICNPKSYAYFHKWSGKPQYKSWYA
jgi:hypothetical protein